MLALNKISIQGNYAAKKINTMKQPPRNGTHYNTIL